MNQQAENIDPVSVENLSGEQIAALTAAVAAETPGVRWTLATVFREKRLPLLPEYQNAQLFDEVWKESPSFSGDCERVTRLLQDSNVVLAG